ncbi:MAG: methyltransferase domain-containing protein, partial [Verrucomicrobiales bacterium]|nr:methyltransferase domain-containing protein [Verrucomicrobiales bacterium]
SDLFPGAADVMLVDVRLPLVFADGSFDRIFTEHMIEHLSWEQGAAMLKECFRIAKPGGVVRVATPNIHFLINLVAKPGDDLHQAYMKWSVDRHIPWAPGLDAVVVMNNFVRDWGHRFVYDEATLGEQLKLAGFSGVVRCTLNASDHDDLRDLENESRMPPGFLMLETLVMEATKPSV